MPDAQPSLILEDRLSVETAELLVRHVGLAAARSVPLPDVLEALADDAGDRTLARIARRLAERLREGATMEEELTEERTSFPPRIRGVLAAGVKANNLPLVIEGYAQIELARRQIRGTLRESIAYPLVIGMLIVPVLVLIGVYIAPMFEALFDEFDMALPESTVVAFRTARVLPLALSGAVVLPAAVAALLSSCGAFWLLHRLRGAIPVFGPLWTWSGQYEFASLMGIFVAARLPLSDALEATSIALADRNVARACPHLQHEIARGVPLGEALNYSMHFDRGLAPLAAWGEQHGVLDEALDIFSRVMQTRIESYAAMLRRVVPVVAVAGVAVLIAGVTIVGFLSPMMYLISGLAGGPPTSAPVFFFPFF